LTTSNKENQPRSIFVEATIISENRIFITDNHLENTVNNIKQNNKVFILAFKEDYSYVFYIKGSANYRIDGGILEEIKNHPDNKGFKPKGVIEVLISDTEEPFNI